MNKSLSCAGGDLGAIRDADEVRMTVMAIFTAELLSWCYDEGLYGVSGLSNNIRFNGKTIFVDLTSQTTRRSP